MNKINFIIISLLFCFGCAHYPLSEDELKNIEKIAVISLLGDNIKFKYVGLTVSDNYEKFHKMPDWNSDEQIREMIREKISKKGSLQYVDITYNSERLMDIYKSTDNIPYSDFDIEYVMKDLEAIRNDYDIDTIVLMAKYKFDALGFPKNNLIGYTIYNGPQFLSTDNKTTIYLCGTMAVVDLRQIKKIAEYDFFYYQDVDNSYWNPKLDELSSEQLLHLKNIYKTALNQKISQSMHNLGLE